MIFINSNQDLTAASGILNVSFLEAIYHSFMDEGLLDLGRQIVVHLLPQVQQDINTQAAPAPQQYNPFFTRTPVPQINTRNTGTRIVTRDVIYNAHIVIGPKDAGDTKGIGNLKENQAAITVVIEALPHILEALSISIEGRRYTVDETRPIGFSTRRYIIAKLTEIQEQEQQNPDITLG